MSIYDDGEDKLLPGRLGEATLRGVKTEEKVTFKTSALPFEERRGHHVVETNENLCWRHLESDYQQP